ncbi:hypothetical protein TSOC_002496 [Tetrabaena socialis]|uniref:Uncharacterized protein n=1 Tax=Tetrabaena socialis TaxID=47790 RepID=A0A2J8ADY9_9CHLO|nr:hypothetical protein TSOC_002496 [Tetrabaena socialis]|eukprot:PNH10722.1 hypothetical protein TSOC_002496 [Tetrabaena socialis]
MRALAPRLAASRPTPVVVSLCRCPSAVGPSRSLGSSHHAATPRSGGASASGQSQRCRSVIRRVAAAMPAVDEDVGVSNAAEAVVQYAINLARASETYEVHSWMLVLGILKYESCTAAHVLKGLGLEDLYGAWHEVLWALHVCDGLKARSFTTEIKFADRAFKVITGATDFAEWHGKDTMYSEDLLVALAAGGVLDGLFPDLNLSFERVRKAVEKQTGRRYSLPDEGDEETAVALVSEDVFL